MIEHFICECPECGTETGYGNWDWENGEICIIGQCIRCGYDILESDGGWVKMVKAEKEK